MLAALRVLRGRWDLQGRAVASVELDTGSWELLPGPSKVVLFGLVVFVSILAASHRGNYVPVPVTFRFGS